LPVHDPVAEHVCPVVVQSLQDPPRFPQVASLGFAQEPPAVQHPVRHVRRLQLPPPPLEDEPDELPLDDPEEEPDELPLDDPEEEPLDPVPPVHAPA